MDRIVYCNFNIDKTKNGYRISCVNDSDIHTHLANLNPAYKLIDNVIANKIPKRCGCYYLECHARLSDNPDYVRKVREYIETKKSKQKQKYYNPHLKKF